MLNIKARKKLIGVDFAPLTSAQLFLETLMALYSPFQWLLNTAEALHWSVILEVYSQLQLYRDI